jgi:hypothetical protein
LLNRWVDFIWDTQVPSAFYFASHDLKPCAEVNTLRIRQSTDPTQLGTWMLGQPDTGFRQAA